MGVSSVAGRRIEENGEGRKRKMMRELGGGLSTRVG